MTSFTKALYRRDPAAAEEFHRQSTFEQRAAHGRPGVLSYGRHPTLAQFTLSAHGTVVERSTAPTRPVFGKRRRQPAMASDCPHSQTFCRDNSLMKANCSACKNFVAGE